MTLHHEKVTHRRGKTTDNQIGQSKTVAELAELDKEDESLQRWKASLGLAGGASGGSKRVSLLIDRRLRGRKKRVDEEGGERGGKEGGGDAPNTNGLANASRHES